MDRHPTLACLVALAMLVAWARADPVTDAAEKTLDVFRAKGDLKDLAAKDDPDPWLVADELCARGDFDAAEAFAQAAPRKDTERLPAYVAAERAQPTDPAGRRALAAADRALAKDDAKAALASAASAPGGRGVTGVRLRHLRGIALRAMRDLEGSAGAFLEAADAAERLGWLAGAVAALKESGTGAPSLPALAACERRLALEELRGNPTGVAETLARVGVIHYSRGAFAKALEVQQRALGMFEESGDRTKVAQTLVNIGGAYHALREPAKSLEHFERARAAFESLGDRQGVAAALGNMGTIHGSVGAYAKALEYQERALGVREESGDLKGVAAMLMRIGALHDAFGNHRRALESFERALKMSEELGDRATVAGALGSLGVVHGWLGEYAKALECHRRALGMAEELGDRAEVCRTLLNIGVIHAWLGEYAKALEHQERALKMKEELGDRAGTAMALGNIGTIYESIGEYAKALEYLERCLDLSQGLGDRAGVARTLGNIGNIRSSLGEPAKALEYQQRALEMFETVGDRAGAAKTLGNLGNVYRGLWDLAKALEYYERALAACDDVGNRLGVAMALEAIAGVFASRGMYPKALEYQDRALKLFEELGNRPGVALSLGNLGGIHLSVGDRGKALECQERALGMYEEQGNRAGVAATLGLIGFLHNSLGDHAKALDHYERALELNRAIGVPVPWLTLELALLLLDTLDRAADAVPFFEETIAAVEAQRVEARGFTDEVQARFLERLRAGLLHEGMARAQLRLGRPGDALAYLERGRARGVLDLLARSRVDALHEAERRARERGDEKRLAAIGEVSEALSAADREVHALTHALSGKQTPENHAALTGKLKQARARRDEVLGRRALLLRELLPVGAPAPVASIQRGLGGRERMLFFSIGESKSLVFVVPPAGKEVEAHELAWPDGSAVTHDGVDAAVRGFLASAVREGLKVRGVHAPKEESVPVDASAGERLLAALVPAAVRAELEDLDRVYVVPHGPLHRLPLEALPGWLDALPPVAYGHSASVLLWCRERRGGQRAGAQQLDVIALGDPVYSRDEGSVEPPEAGVLVVRGGGDLEAGDVVVSYDGQTVADGKVLAARIVEAEEKGSVAVRVWRAGREIDLSLPPGPLGIEIAKEPPREAWPKLREESLLTLQRGASADKFGPLQRLPGTRREVEAIGKTLARSQVLLGEDATKSALFRLAPRAKFVHLATHQLVDETERRGYSRLALTVPPIATPEDDGFLSLFELFDKWRDRLSGCELVVLSACETVKGPMQKDEGPYAMPLGFLYAGAPAVIGSLWRVDDASTAELFADFYARVAKGGSKLEAFTAARKALKKKHPEPYFWAPFVYIGDPR